MEMSALEIFSGSLLILSALIIIVLVMMQTSKGKGLSGAIGGDNAMSAGEGQYRSKDVKLAFYTKIAAIVFFVANVVVIAVTLLV